jgi:hypothetical protein
MIKHHQLLDHFRNPKNRDRSSLLLKRNPDQLRFTYSTSLGDWNTVVSYIAGPLRWPVTWFPDANVAFLGATWSVWDALRLAALGSPNPTTVISGVAEAEMADWLNDPYHNKERAAAIKAAMENETWIKKFRIGPSDPLNAALYGYALLLGFRRLLAQPCPDGTTLLDTDPADKSETMNAIRKKIGPRAVGLAKKGRDDADAKGVISISDELHCLMAILYALRNRRDTVILTADSDYIEIFYKAQWFFDTHYRAWLAGKLINAGKYGEPVKEIKEPRGYFDGPITLYRRATAQMYEILPFDSRSVRVGVLYVAPDGMLHTPSFPFELQMLELLDTRALTGGRCTDLFGDANIHIDLGPLKSEMDGLYLGIGKDSTDVFNLNGTSLVLARLDLEHSICCNERYAS